MQQALDLAQKGRYSTRPNPAVGCVLVKENEVVGTGWHQRSGEPHAERHALAQAQQSAQGATAYVTLEPCSHFGRTAPCADGLIEGGVKKVYVAMLDPNPLVSGQGVQRLEQAGIEVITGLLGAEAEALNRGFVRRMEQGLPYVVLKMASSLDGRTALSNGESQWITDGESRLEVHKLRAASGAIITGIGTVLADDPSLTVRLPPADLAQMNLDGENFPPPLRVVLDSSLKIPLKAKLFTEHGRILVVTSQETYQQKSDQVKALSAQDQVTVLAAPSQAEQGGGVNLQYVLQYLAQKESVNSVMVEAGATLAGAFISENRVDELHTFMAPCLLGDQARPMFILPNIQRMADKVPLHIVSVEQLGEDVKIVLKRQKNESESESKGER
ncbi:MAG TPA: bifunctional diaminohydroxyphosphoribosylaminopyrimidine deaminase/5-amino-6-(5-phosphoribosylamino)uracil reductase RibD [Thiomicrorhabdus sp.]|nr:bifunctional diaminohydroxyphosphoribosylaminopyrimidine deaminase/5-amino-6-(5-phosphoribosylamino)uracil reductase RibD [Thiomicrorhabdus sp.]